MLSPSPFSHSTFLFLITYHNLRFLHFLNGKLALWKWLIPFIVVFLGPLPYVDSFYFFSHLFIAWWLFNITSGEFSLMAGSLDREGKREAGLHSYDFDTFWIRRLCLCYMIDQQHLLVDIGWDFVGCLVTTYLVRWKSSFYNI